MCSKISAVEELLTVLSVQKEKLQYEKWERNSQQQISHIKVSEETRLLNFSKALAVRKSQQSSASVFQQNKILKAFENAFKQQVEDYKRYGSLPVDTPTPSAPLEAVEIDENVLDSDNEYEKFLDGGGTDSEKSDDEKSGVVVEENPKKSEDEKN